MKKNFVKFLMFTFLLGLISVSYQSCSKDESITTEDLFLREGYIESANANVKLGFRQRNEDPIIGKVSEVIALDKAARKKAEKLGYIAWTASHTFDPDKGLYLYSLPIINQNSLKTEAVLFGTMQEGYAGQKLKMATIKREEVDKALKNQESELKINGKPIDLGRIILLFSIADGNLFGKTDCVYAEYLKSENFSNGEKTIVRSECHLVYVGSEYVWVDGTYHWEWNQTDGWEEAVIVPGRYVRIEIYDTVCINEPDYPDSGNQSPDPYGDGGGTSTSDPDKTDNVDPSGMMKYLSFECIYNMMLQGNYSMFNNTICQFENMRDVTIKFVSCLDDNVAGCGSSYTDPYIKDGVIKIVLENDLNPLMMATTILHEGIHAAILLNLKEKNIDLPNGVDFVTYMKYYKQYGGYRDWADHVFIADFYIKPMAKNLRKLENYKFPEYYYYGVVYEGIERAITDANVQRLIDDYADFMQYNSRVLSESTLCK